MRRRRPVRWGVVVLGLLAGLARAQDGGVPGAEPSKRLWPAEPAAALTTVTVTVDLSGLDEAGYRRLDGLALEKRLVLRLVQDGFAVLAASASATVRLALASREGVLQLHARSSACPDELREVPFGDEPVAELHLELAQKAADLARTCTPPPPVLPPPRPPAPPSALSVTGAAGLEFRQGGLDPTVQLAVRFGRVVGGEVALTLVPSRGEAISVLDTRLLVGVSLRLSPLEELTLDAGLHLGAQLHAFRFDDGASGAAVDLMAAVPLSLTWWPNARVGVGLRLSPGVALANPYLHARGEKPSWSRGPAALDALGVLALRL